MSKRITLDILTQYVKTLCEQKTNQNTSTFNTLLENKSLQKSFSIINEVNSHRNIEDFPPNCKKIFELNLKNIYRHCINGNLATSLYYSVLFCITNKFATIDNIDMYIEILKNKMIADLTEKKLFTILKYRQYKWTIKDVSDAVKNNTNNKLTIRYVADYFNINIFLVNINKDSMSAIFNNDGLNIHKPSIFLTLYDNVFEPLSISDKFLWNNTDAYNKLVFANLFSINGINYNNNTEIISLVNDDLEKYLLPINESTIHDTRMNDILLRSNSLTNTSAVRECYDYYTDNTVDSCKNIIDDTIIDTDTQIALNNVDASTIFVKCRAQ